MSGNYNNNNNRGGNQRNTVLGTSAGTGFRTMAAAVARRNRGRGRDRDNSDDEYFENPNRNNSNPNNRRNNNNNQKRSRTQSNNRTSTNRRSSKHSPSSRRDNSRAASSISRNNNNKNNRRDGRTGRSSNVSYSMASSRSSSVDSYLSSNDSHPNHTSNNTRSVHSRSTYQHSYATHSSLSAYTESYSDSYSDDDSVSSYSRTTTSSRSYSRTMTTTTLTHTKGGSTIATNTLRGQGAVDNRSTLHGNLTSAASVNYLSSRHSTLSASNANRTASNNRDRNTARTQSERDDDQSYGAGSASDSADSHHQHQHRSSRRGASRSRSPTQLKRISTEKLAIAAVLDATAAGGFDCLLEDPSKQPSTKRAKASTAGAKGSKGALAASQSRRRTSKSVDRQSSIATSQLDDDAKSLRVRKAQAAEYRLNVPILQRFCTEFSAPFGFVTAEAEVYAQQLEQQALGIHRIIEIDASTGVPLNTRNAANAVLMASVNKAVNFVIQQAPHYPSEMVRAVLWRVVQSSQGPHDRLGSWKLVDGVLRCLHNRHGAFLKLDQSLKRRESDLQQQKHVYESQKQQRNAAAAESGADADAVAIAEAENDRQFYSDISAAMRLIDSERTKAKTEVNWARVMLVEFGQLLPYLVLYCWGGDKTAGASTGGSSSRRANRAAAGKKATAGGSHAGSADASSAGATASNASEDGGNGLDGSVAADLDVVKRRVMDFVAGRVHGDGTMTARGQHHHATLLRHHHTLENLAASTANPRNTITTQSRFAVGHGLHLTSSKAMPIVTEKEISVMNQQIFAEYDNILRGWGQMFASGLYYVSYTHIRRAVADYIVLLTDHESSSLINRNMTQSKSRNREGSELYHFALKASHLRTHQNAAAGGAGGAERSVSQQVGDSIYFRQREVFETFLLPPARMIDSLWRFRRAEPRPSLVASVLAQYGFPVFKAAAATADADNNGPSSSSAAGVYDANGAAARRTNNKTTAADAVTYCFPKSPEEVKKALGFEFNDRLFTWIAKAAEHQGGCPSCDTWAHTFNTCPYRPSRFVALNRQIVATMSASEAVDLVKVSAAGRSFCDRSAAAATLAAIAGGGVSADRAGSDANTVGGAVSLEEQGAARKQLVMDILDAAAERAAAGVEMDTLLNALDVLLRQSSTGRERQAIALLASYRLQPSKMMQFTSASSNSVAPISRKTGRRKHNLVDFSRSGRTVAAEKLLAFLTQEHRYYESGRLRSAMEVLYFRYLCIPHNDAVLVQQLQRDITLIRENRYFVDVLCDDEAPLESRIFAVAPKSVLAAAVNRVKRVAHLLDPCTLELSPCCAGAAVDSIRQYNAQQAPHREVYESTEPWDWFVARQVLKSERLVPQNDGLSANVGDYANKFQYADELITRLDELAEAYESRSSGRDDGRFAASRLRLVAHIIRQCGFCTSCNRFGHTRRTCAELANVLIRTSLSDAVKNRLNIRSLTTARVAFSAMVTEVQRLQAAKQQARHNDKDLMERDINRLREIIDLLGGSQASADNTMGGRGGRGRGGQRGGAASRLPPAVALIARRVGGVRSGQIDLGTTAIAPALPPAIGAAISAITTQTGLALADLRFCPDECLALFQATSAHHLAPHVAAFRSSQFPHLLITTSQFEDDAFEDRALNDRANGGSVSHHVSSQALAQLTNPNAKRRVRTYALPANDFFQLALRFDGTGAIRNTTNPNLPLSDGLARAMNAQQLCRDRYLDLAAFLMRTTGSGSVSPDGIADFETMYGLMFPSTAEGRAVRQQLLSRGQALHEELARRITLRVPPMAPNAPIDQRPYGTVYEVERDYYARNLTAESDKSAYTFVAAVQCRNTIATRLRQFTTQRAIPAAAQQQPFMAPSSSQQSFASQQQQQQQRSVPTSQLQQFAPPIGLLPPTNLMPLLPPSQPSYGAPAVVPSSLAAAGGYILPPLPTPGVVPFPPAVAPVSQQQQPRYAAVPAAAAPVAVSQQQQQSAGGSSFAIISAAANAASSNNVFRGRLSSGILFSSSQQRPQEDEDHTAVATKEADAIVSAMAVAPTSVDYNAAEEGTSAAAEPEVGQKRARSDEGTERTAAVRRSPRTEDTA